MSTDDPEPGAAVPMLPLDRVRDRLARLYRELDARIAALGPVCQLSGRCCRFREYGHRLYLSSLEAAYLLDQAPPPVRPLDDGARCPWQDDLGHCQARSGRPLACRVYFCDPNFEGQAEPLSEAFLRQLKTFADEAGLPWDYRSLHEQLRARLATGGEANRGDLEARTAGSRPGRLDTSPSDPYS